MKPKQICPHRIISYYQINPKEPDKIICEKLNGDLNQIKEVVKEYEKHGTITLKSKINDQKRN